MKIGSKSNSFQRKGQAWFCTTGLPSDVVIDVEEMSFHLHKFPLITRSGKLATLVEAYSDEKVGITHVDLPGLPGGPDAFELAAKFCYGVRLELTAANVVILRCAAEYLEMTEEYGQGNLIARTEGFVNQVLLGNWKESIHALHGCEPVLAKAEELGLVKRCVDSIIMKACTDPNLFGWPMMERGTMQSPGGSVLWNGIRTGAKPRQTQSGWWYEDVSLLSLPLFKRLIVSMEARGLKAENIGGSLMHFAKRHLPVLNRRQGLKSGTRRLGSTIASVLSEVEQKVILEVIEELLPLQKGVVSTKFLCGLLRSAMLLNASPVCKSNLEHRIGLQLEEASVEDLLFPNLSYNLETLYDVDCVQSIVDHFLLVDESTTLISPPTSVDDGQLRGSPSLTPMMMVGRLMDSYLAEVASDVNLKPSKFQLLAEALPDFARLLDDGLYRAIDIYLKAHPWLSDQEQGKLCRFMDCQKLSLEACTHAAQNERLPLRVVVQVLFFEQLHLRTAIASCFLVSDNIDNSRPLRHHNVNDGTFPAAALRGEGWVNAVRENYVLKIDMDTMKLRVNELERECSCMKQEIERLGKLGGPWQLVSRMFGSRFRSQLCSSKEGVVSSQTAAGHAPLESPHETISKHRGNSSRAA